MTRKILKNKPLVEAIFELRWELQPDSSGVKKDPHYKILIGGIYEKVRNEYPFHEQLPTASIPDEIAGYVVQHQFRKNENEWPLIQVGPGIITLNDTDGYVWDDFQKRIAEVLSIFLGTYPNSSDLKLNGLLLRYIDAVDFNYEGENVFIFLRERMKMDINLQQELFESTGVDKLPFGLDLRFSFPSTKPSGIIHLRFARGKRKGIDALIWEEAVQLTEINVPMVQEEIIAWVDEAHNLIDDWFFKIIEGELLRRFE